MYKIEIWQKDNTYYKYEMTKKQVNILEKKMNNRRCKYLSFLEKDCSMLLIPKNTILKIIIKKW